MQSDRLQMECKYKTMRLSGNGAEAAACKNNGCTWDASTKHCECTPDLGIEYFGINSTSVIKGGNYILGLTIKNNGKGRSASTLVNFSGSPDVISIYNLSVPKSVPPIDAGHMTTLSFNPTSNSLNIPVGSYTIKAVVNANGASFKELSLQNNEKVLTFGVIAQSNMGKPVQKIPQSGGSIKD